MKGMGIGGIIHLILVVYAGIQIINSSAEPGSKVLWILLVAAFPLIGLLIWFFAGPGSPKQAT